MAKKIKHGVQLVNQSLKVIYNNKKLLVFPMISSIIVLSLAVAIFHPLARFEQAQIIAMHQNTNTVIMAYAVILLFFFTVHQISFYFNAAISYCTLAHFAGKPVSLKAGLAAANASLWKFYLWNLFAGTAGILINVFQSKIHQTKFYQQLFCGLRWLIATHLITPILVTDKIGPIKAIKQSARLVWNTWAHETAITWKDNLKSNCGFITLVLIGRVIFVIPAIIGAMAGGHRNIIIGLIGSAILLLLITVVSNITQTVLSCALYLFAKNGFVPKEFNEKLLRDAFKIKSQRH